MTANNKLSFAPWLLFFRTMETRCARCPPSAAMVGDEDKERRTEGAFVVKVKSLDRLLIMFVPQNPGTTTRQNRYICGAVTNHKSDYMDTRKQTLATHLLRPVAVV